MKMNVSSSSSSSSGPVEKNKQRIIPFDDGTHCLGEV